LLNLQASSDFTLATEILKYSIHLLETSSSRLWDKEECPSKTEAAEDGEENISAITCILNEWRCDEPDDEVVEPVRRGTAGC
jgi:hypothetical protein